MAVTYVAQSNASEITRMTTGQFTTTDASTATITLGYTPRLVILLEETAPGHYIWAENMTASKIIKTVAAGTVTLDTTQLVTATDNGFTFVPINASDTYTWVAYG